MEHWRPSHASGKTHCNDAKHLTACPYNHQQSMAVAHPGRRKGGIQYAAHTRQSLASLPSCSEQHEAPPHLCPEVKGNSDAASIIVSGNGPNGVAHVSGPVTILSQNGADTYRVGIEA